MKRDADSLDARTAFSMACAMASDWLVTVGSVSTTGISQDAGMLGDLMGAVCCDTPKGDRASVSDMAADADQLSGDDPHG
jgi:hypothetical protein